MRIGISSASEASEDDEGGIGSRLRPLPHRLLRSSVARDSEEPMAPAGTATGAGTRFGLRPLPHRVLRSSTIDQKQGSITPSASRRRGSSRAFSPDDDDSETMTKTRGQKTTILPPWIKAGKVSITANDSHSEASTSSCSTSSSSDDEDHPASSPTRFSQSRNVRRVADGRVARSGSYQLSPPSAASKFSSPSNKWSVSVPQEGDNALSSDLPTSDSDEQDRTIGPVHRKVSRGITGIRSNRGTPSPSKKGEDREHIRSIRLATEEDQWEGEWTDAIRRTGKRLASLALRSSQSPFSSPPPSTPSSRQQQQQQQHQQQQSLRSPPIIEEDQESVQSTLSRLRLEEEQLKQREGKEFEERGKALWGSIEGAIKAAEERAQRRAKEEADRIAAVRRRQEEMEHKAKAAKEEEEKKRREEEKAKEKRIQEAEARKKMEEEKVKAAEAKREEEAKAKEAMKSMGIGDALHIQAREDYQRWTNAMKNVKEKVLPVIAENPQWRKQCFAAKRQITPKIGQLTNSRAEIWRITSSLSALLKEARDAPCPNQEIYKWVLNHLSKCLIRQAEQEVAVKIDTAYPLARVVVLLLLDGHEQLGEILMARLVKKSCWCIGFVPEKRGDQDATAYAKSIGRSSPDETSIQFSSRQSGIVALYFAICQTPPSPPPSSSTNNPSKATTTMTTPSSSLPLSLVPPHFRPSALWTWQARCITPPMTNHALLPSLWSVLLEIAGPRLLEIYRRQTIKLWNLLYSQGIRQRRAHFVNLDEATSASGRLQLILEDWIKTNGGRGGEKMERLRGREMDP